MHREYNPVYKKRVLESKEYISIERDLVILLHDIWRNRNFISGNDIEKLKFFKEKGL